MPAESKAQQAAAGAAYEAKKKGSPEGLRGASLEMYNSMTLEELRDFAKGSTEGKPEKVAKESFEDRLDKILTDFK